MTLPELIASEVMDTIERERRINKDDLIIAAEVAIGKFKKEQERAHPLMVATPTDESMQNILTQQAMVDAEKEYMRIDSQKGGGFDFYVNEPMQTGGSPTFTGALTTASDTATVIAKPGCIPSAEAAQKSLSLAGMIGWMAACRERDAVIESAKNDGTPFYGKSLPDMIDEARQRLIAKQQQAAAVRASKSWMTE